MSYIAAFALGILLIGWLGMLSFLCWQLYVLLFHKTKEKEGCEKKDAISDMDELKKLRKQVQDYEEALTVYKEADEAGRTPYMLKGHSIAREALDKHRSKE